MEKYAYQSLIEYLSAEGSGCLWKADAPLSAYCSFHIGGPADIVIHPGSVDALCRVTDLLRGWEIPFIVCGNGSNVLFADDGYRGAVIFTTGMKTIRFIPESEGGCLYAEAGASLTAVSLMAAKHGLTGLEFAYGIPGSCGGALFMNAGAFGGEMKDVVTASTYYDRSSGEIGTLEGEAHEFSYRHSVYSVGDKIILSVTMRCLHAAQEEIEAAMDHNMAYRRNSQPLEYPSAGSVFKRYPGYYTSRLIEEAGLKGKTIGGACVSEKHAGFIINKGGATAADVLALIALIRETVYQRRGIWIEPEICCIP